MKYGKHLLVIKDKSYNIGNNIAIDEDLDSCYNTLSFDIPYYEEDTWSTKNITYHDRIQVYFKFFNTPDERDSANIEDLNIIFDGYVDENPLNENKSSGINWASISCKSTFGLAYERPTKLNFFSSTIDVMLNEAIDDIGLSDLISINVNELKTTFLLDIDSTPNFGKVCDNIKSKYAIKIYQTPNGVLNIASPSYFIYDKEQAYEYNMQTNIFNIDYGNISTRVNSVVVIGTNCIGAAYDPIAYQLMLGVEPEDLSENVVPDQIYLYPRYIERKNFIGNNEACQQLARELLLDYAKNYTITFESVYIPEQTVGDKFIIKNSAVIPETQQWIIKKRNILISKENIKCKIVAYSNGLTFFPDDILLDSSGILDTDILNISDKVENAVNPNNL